MAKNEEFVTGLEDSTCFEQDEKSIITALMSAAQYKTQEDSIRKINIKKPSGEKLFSFRIRALSQSEIQTAAKKATKQIPNPAGRKYPPISGERNVADYHNRLVYMATIEEDRQKIWGNKEMKNKFGIFEDSDMVDILLRAGDKSKVVDAILTLSGYDDEEVVDDDEYIKNS